MSDLQALFATLKVKSRDAATNSDAGNTDDFRQDSLRNVSASPSPANPPPATLPSFIHQISNPLTTFSPSSTAVGNNDRAQSLLSLLNFGRPASVVNAEPEPHSNPVARPRPENIATNGNGDQAPKMSASELVASFLTSSSPAPGDQDTSEKNIRADVSALGDKQHNPQDALLNLLSTSRSRTSRSSQPQNDDTTPVSTARGSRPSGGQLVANMVNGNSMAERTTSPIRLFGTSESQETTPFEVPQADNSSRQTELPTLFTYKNPFEALNASRNQTPQPQTPAQRTQGPIEKSQSILRAQSPNHFEETEEASFNTSSTRRKLTPKVPMRASSQGLKSSPAQDSGDFNDSREPFPSVDDSAPVLLPEDTIAEQMYQDHGVAGVPPQLHATVEPGDTAADIVEPDIKEEPTDAADVWEDAEDSPKETSARDVPVYNFPIKPFVSITLKPGPSSDVGVRHDGVMEISRLKKEFDQLDRSLAAATNKYICYALIKNGGIRLIRQDDGADKSVFKNCHDRCFNVALCTTATNAAPTNEQAVLGTGVSGSVYFATISKEGKDLFEADILGSESLIFPPFPPGDENMSGGVLKTRAKKSSRHPEFFAIGRGKSIHLIWPATAMSSRYGISGDNKMVDIEKLYKERCLKIITGKAGKDFAFSEDDTVIASLDKIGRLRFWDIRPLVNDLNAISAKVDPIEIDIPLLSLATASPSEKSWPTSVLFLDKSRPYSKGGALRYVLLGLKQNHTLQLWDVALGKAVQELNFPHESETDGICSLAYHPSSGIIVVGHPTRNSIYFVHLSAPRYTLPVMSQAAYVHRLAGKDPDLPKPDSTACMSGIREISFAAKGNLRSIELLPIHKSSDSKLGSDAASLFELYIVHSKGVTCLTITKDDLGWTSESKVKHSINAVEAGLIELKDLRLGNFIGEGIDHKQSAEEPYQMHKSAKKKANKKSQVADEPSIPALAETEVEPTASGPLEVLPHGSTTFDTVEIQAPADRESKKSKKKAARTVKETGSPSLNLSPTKPSVSDQVGNRESNSVVENLASVKPAPQVSIVNDEGRIGNSSDTVTVDISGEWLDKELKKIEHGVSGEFRKELNALYRNLQNDRSVQDSAAVARQEAVLRLVSSMLSTNIEAALAQMISAQMQQVVVPALASVTVQAVTAQVGEAVAKALHHRIPQDLDTHLPIVLDAALQNPHILRMISDSVSQKLASHLERNIHDTLQNSIKPAFKELADSAAHKAAANAEMHLGGQLRRLESDRRSDLAKIENLSTVLLGMAETVQSMSDSQVAFQGQILRDRRQLVQTSEVGSDSGARPVSTHRSFPARSSSPAAIGSSVEDIETQEISQLMLDGKYEEASIKWLQSTQQIELFDRVFVRYTPDYLTEDVSPLVAFSVAITVANSLATNTSRRLQWINAAFDAVDLNDPELADLSRHAPGLLHSLVQKLNHLYTQTTERNQNDPLLRAIDSLSLKASEMTRRR